MSSAREVGEAAVVQLERDGDRRAWAIPVLGKEQVRIRLAGRPTPQQMVTVAAHPDTEDVNRVYSPAPELVPARVRGADRALVYPVYTQRADGRASDGGNSQAWARSENRL